MVYEEFKKAITSLKKALDTKPEETPKTLIGDFKRSRTEHLSKISSGYLNALKRLAPKLSECSNDPAILKRINISDTCNILI